MMKNVFLLAALSLCLFQSCDNDDNEPVPGYVSAETKAAFDEKYPAAKDVEWETRNDYLIVDFKQDKVEKEAWFDNSGTWYMTETDIPFAQLPDAVKTAFQQGEYSTWKVDDVDMIERRDVETVYVIEANPRASRTVPFISKATGVPLAKCAARIMAGDSIASLGLPSDERQLDWFCMKEAVMPWGRFPGADVILGPEMKSTGEVMGIAKSYPEAYAKTQLAIDYKLPDPSAGKVFISVCDRDKRHILSVARILRYLGFDICSTEGTARVLRGGNVTCEVVEKISGPHDGERPNIGDLIADGKIAVIINTPYGPGSRGDGYLLRTEAVRRGVTCVTAMSAANTYVSAIEAVREDQQGHGSANDMGMDVIALQDLPQHTV